MKSSRISLSPKSIDMKFKIPGQKLINDWKLSPYNKPCETITWPKYRAEATGKCAFCDTVFLWRYKKTSQYLQSKIYIDIPLLGDTLFSLFIVRQIMSRNHLLYLFTRLPLSLVLCRRLTKFGIKDHRDILRRFTSSCSESNTRAPHKSKVSQVVIEERLERNNKGNRILQSRRKPITKNGLVWDIVKVA